MRGSGGGSIGAEMMSHGEERPRLILQMQGQRFPPPHNSVCFALMSPRSVLLETAERGHLSQPPGLVTIRRGAVEWGCLSVCLFPSASRACACVRPR